MEKDDRHGRSRLRSWLVGVALLGFMLYVTLSLLESGWTADNILQTAAFALAVWVAWRSLYSRAGKREPLVSLRTRKRLLFAATAVGWLAVPPLVYWSRFGGDGRRIKFQWHVLFILYLVCGVVFWLLYILVATLGNVLDSQGDKRDVGRNEADEGGRSK